MVTSVIRPFEIFEKKNNYHLLRDSSVPGTHWALSIGVVLFIHVSLPPILKYKLHVLIIAVLPVPTVIPSRYPTNISWIELMN